VGWWPGRVSRFHRDVEAYAWPSCFYGTFAVCNIYKVVRC